MSHNNNLISSSHLQQQQNDNNIDNINTTTTTKMSPGEDAKEENLSLLLKDNIISLSNNLLVAAQPSSCPVTAGLLSTGISSTMSAALNYNLLTSPHSPTAEHVDFQLTINNNNTINLTGLERMGKILVPTSIVEQERLDDKELFQRTHPVIHSPNELVLNNPCSYCKLLGTVRRGSSPEGLPLVTMCEVRRHCVPEDCWLLCREFIYDATLFLQEHPGGQRAILKRAGGIVDCGIDMDFHSSHGRIRWKELLIAKLVPCAGDKISRHYHRRLLADNTNNNSYDNDEGSSFCTIM
jgi:hypothetical protein